ncbi:MAG: RNA polymerase sigma factor [Candidatus Omnitrophota bacterium]
MTDTELVQKCIAQDHLAWDIFIKQFKSTVLKCVRYKLKKMQIRLPRRDEEDIVQEIFISIWENSRLSAIQDISCLKSWLAILSLNYTVNYCRKQYIQNSSKTCSLDAVISNTENLTFSDILPSPNQDTASMIRSNELLNTLDKEIAEMPVKKQLVLKLSFYDGLKQKDISSITRIPENSVASIIKRGKEKLRAKFKDI